MTDEEKKARARFWVLFSLWTLFAVVVPVTFICLRYHLFTVVSSIQIGGWGLVVVIIVGAFVLAIWKYVKSTLTKTWSMTTQVISGTVRIIVPLAAVYFAVWSIRQSIDMFLQVMAVVMACEAIAIPLNPMPKWAYDKSQGATMDAIELCLAKREDKAK